MLSQCNGQGCVWVSAGQCFERHFEKPLASDVQAVLNAEDEYNTDLFLDEIAQMMQSNDESIGDDELEFIVSHVEQ